MSCAHPICSGGVNRLFFQMWQNRLQLWGLGAYKIDLDSVTKIWIFSYNFDFIYHSVQIPRPNWFRFVPANKYNGGFVQVTQILAQIQNVVIWKYFLQLRHKILSQCRDAMAYFIHVQYSNQVLGALMHIIQKLSLCQYKLFFVSGIEFVLRYMFYFIFITRLS